MIYYNGHKCVPFYNDYRPLNVMRNGKQLGGWRQVSEAIDNNQIELQNTYNDSLEYVVHGKSEQVAKLEHFVIMNQMVSVPNAMAETGGYYSATSYTSISQDSRGVQVIPAYSTSSTMVQVSLCEYMVGSHRYMAVLKTPSDPQYINFRLHKTGTNAPRYLRGEYAMYEIDLTGSYDITDTNKCYLRCDRQGYNWWIQEFALIDITMAYGGIVSTTANRIELMSDILRKFGFPEYVLDGHSATEETNVDFSPNKNATNIVRGGGEITPESPASVDPVTVTIVTNKSIGIWDGLQFGDTCDQDGVIRRYTRTVHIYDLEWSVYSSANHIFSAPVKDILGDEIYMAQYTRYTNMSDWTKWGFYFSNGKLYVKDNMCSTVDEFIQKRGYSLIWYRGNYATRDKETPQPLLTSPYRTMVASNTDATITYKKFDI